MSLESLNWSAVISGIALIVAIISPVVTTILNNRHQDKMWIRDNFSRHKTEVIENYVKSTGTVLKKATTDTLADYGNCYGEIFFYTPESVWPLIEKIDKAIVYRAIREEEQQIFVELCKQLSSFAKRPEK